MPFTLAHPALIIPLKKVRGGLSLTALAVGSMVPDFENFFNMQETEVTSHQLSGFFLFDLPVGLFACFLFHNLLKHGFVENLPRFYQRRFSHLVAVNWNSYAAKNPVAVIFSLVMGILSHLSWDAFTHHDGLVVSFIPFLSAEINLFGKSLPIFFILQLVSSVAGCWFVYKMISRMPQTAARNPFRQKITYWLVFAGSLLLIMAIRFLCWPDAQSYLSIIKACMGGLLYAWVTASFIYKYTGWIKFKTHP